MSERLSDRRTLPSQLHGEALTLAGLLARETRDGVAIVGAAGDLVYWNSAAGAITGGSSITVAEQNVGKFTTTPKALIEIREGKWVEVRQSPLRGDGQSYTEGMFTDATLQVHLRGTRAQLQSLGLIDSTTNLPGREVARLHVDH